jgi:hypothetical protein
MMPMGREQPPLSSVATVKSVRISRAAQGDEGRSGKPVASDCRPRTPYFRLTPSSCRSCCIAEVGLLCAKSSPVRNF